MERAVKGDIKEYCEQQDVSKEEILNAAPILKPDQVDVIYESQNKKNIQVIKDLLPFLSEDLVDQLAVRAAQEGNEQDLVSLMPFVSKDTVSDIAHKMMAEGKSITRIAPFLDEEVLSEFIKKEYL